MCNLLLPLTILTPREWQIKNKKHPLRRHSALARRRLWWTIPNRQRTTDTWSRFISIKALRLFETDKKRSKGSFSPRRYSTHENHQMRWHSNLGETPAREKCHKVGGFGGEWGMIFGLFVTCQGTEINRNKYRSKWGSAVDSWSIFCGVGAE
jgi:hypothetical protein